MDLQKTLDAQKVKTFRIELYPETESYNFDNVHNLIDKKFDWIRILHDKDLKEDGTPCAKHYHYVIRTYQYSCRRSNIAEYLGIDKVWILPCYGKDETSDDALMYLTHFNRPEKHQYNKSEVEFQRGSKLFNRFDILVQSAAGVDDITALNDICQFIYKQETYLYMPCLLEFIGVNNYLYIYRKYNYSIHRMMDEHNNMIYHRVKGINFKDIDKIIKFDADNS